MFVHAAKTCLISILLQKFGITFPEVILMFWLIFCSSGAWNNACLGKNFPVPKDEVQMEAKFYSNRHF